MTEQPNETTEDAQLERPRAVRVPTGRDAHGYDGWIDCTPEAAPGWDARRWERLS